MGLEDLISLAALVGLVGVFTYLFRKGGKKTAADSPWRRRADEASQVRPDPEVLSARDREIELRFVNVFAMLTEPRREGLISHYRETEGVARIRAMERACEDWEKHNRLPN